MIEGLFEVLGAAPFSELRAVRADGKLVLLKVEATYKPADLQAVVAKGAA